MRRALYCPPTPFKAAPLLPGKGDRNWKTYKSNAHVKCPTPEYRDDPVDLQRMQPFLRKLYHVRQIKATVTGMAVAFQRAALAACK